MNAGKVKMALTSTVLTKGWMTASHIHVIAINLVPYETAVNGSFFYCDSCGRRPFVSITTYVPTEQAIDSLEMINTESNQSWL